MGVGVGVAAGLAALAAGGGMGLGIMNSNAAQARAKAARQQQEQSLQQASNNYQAYRPELARANTNTLQQTTGLLAPLNNKVGDFFGSGAKMDFGAATKNPFSRPGLADPNAATGATPAMGFLGPAASGQVMSLYQQGWAPPKISAMTGVPLSQVLQHLQQQGVSTNGMKGA